MAKLYRNAQLTLGSSAFIEVGDFDGSSVAFTAKNSVVKKGGVSLSVTAGKAAYREPIDVTTVDGGIVEFAGGFTLQFNIKTGDTAALAAYKAECMRVFAIAENEMAHGFVPGAAANFAAV